MRTKTNVKGLEKKHREIEKQLRKDPHNKKLITKLTQIEKKLGM